MIRVTLQPTVYATGQKYWLVYASDNTAKKWKYRRKWRTQQEAESDRMRLLSGATDLDMQEAITCLRMLKTSVRPGKGASLTQAVTYFLEKFESGGSQTVKELAKTFVARKATELAEKSMIEIRSHMRHFVAAFGHQNPEDTKVEQLENYLAANTSRSYRDKTLRPFFEWLAGKCIQHCTALENPPLKRSTFDFIARARYEKMGKIDFLRVAEVKTLITAAKGSSSLGYIIVLLLTGARPEEIQGMIKLGLDRYIDFDRGTITIPAEVSKTGGGREVPIRKSLKQWLKRLQHHSIPISYSRRDVREVWESVFPKRKRQDILRHTYLSHANRVTPAHDLLIQTATSLSMLRKHYLRLVTTAEAKQFFLLAPADFGL